MLLNEIRSTGARPPLFVFPNVIGIGDLPTILAQQLGPEQPVYALDRVTHGETYCADFKELARSYRDAIRQAGHHGPLRFAGFSYGAQAAYATTLHLEEIGETVEFLGVLDDDADVDRRGFGSANTKPNPYSRWETAVTPVEMKPLVPISAKVTLFRSRLWSGPRRPGIAMEWEFLARGGVDVFTAPYCSHAEFQTKPHVQLWAKDLNAQLKKLDGDTGDGASEPLFIPSQVDTIPAPALTAFDLAKLGDLDGEIHHYGLALAENPQAPEWVSLNLAAALRQKGDVQQEHLVLRRAAPLTDFTTIADLEYARFMQRNQMHKELRRKARAADLQHSESACDWQARGMFFQILKLPRRAEACFRKAMEFDQNRTDCLGRLVRLMLTQERVPDALAATRAGLARDPNSTFLRLLFCQVMMAAGDEAAAESELRSIIQSDKNRYRTYALLCTILRNRGSEEEAMALANEGLRRNPHHFGLLKFVEGSPLR